MKAIRHDSLLISYEMSKANAFFVVFILLALATVIGILVIPNTPLRSLGEMLIFWVIPIPALWAEVGWLLQDKLVKQTLQYRSKLGAHVR